MRKKIIQTVGKPSDRFQEDMTRVLRAIRFAVSLNFTLHPNTKKAIQTIIPEIHKTRSVIDGRGETQEKYVAAREIIAKELALAFTRQPFKTAELLFSSGVLVILFPEVDAIRQQQKDYFAPLQKCESADLSVILSLFYREINEAAIEKMWRHSPFDSLESASLYRADRKTVLELVRWIQDPETIEMLLAAPPHEFRRQIMNEQRERLMTLLRLLDKEEQAAAIQKQIDLYCKHCNVKHPEDIQPLVHGKDLIDTLGIAPGPEIRPLLEKALDLQMTGEGKTKKSLLDALKKDLAST